MTTVVSVFIRVEETTLGSESPPNRGDTRWSCHTRMAQSETTALHSGRITSTNHTVKN
jgi:hypothetical protein